eukprot:g2038.t1
MILIPGIFFGLRAHRVPSSPSAPAAAYEARLSELRLATSGRVDAALRAQRFLVIGGTGFTGTALVHDLLGRGVAPSRIRVMSRGTVGADKAIAGVDYFRGSFTKKASLAQALDQITVVYHTAASYGNPAFGMMGEQAAAAVDAVNAGGMETLVAACRASSTVELLVYCSSVDTVFTGRTAVNITEDDTPYAQEEWSHYTHSKIRAEKICLAADEPAAGG